MISSESNKFHVPRYPALLTGSVICSNLGGLKAIGDIFSVSHAPHGKLTTLRRSINARPVPGPLKLRQIRL
jgi:hypothetical protein